MFVGRFQAQTAPWALPWKPSLSLRFSTQEGAAGRAPASMQPSVNRALIVCNHLFPFVRGLKPVDM